MLISLPAESFLSTPPLMTDQNVVQLNDNILTPLCTITALCTFLAKEVWIYVLFDLNLHDWKLFNCFCSLPSVSFFCYNLYSEETPSNKIEAFSKTFLNIAIECYNIKNWPISYCRISELISLKLQMLVKWGGGKTFEAKPATTLCTG